MKIEKKNTITEEQREAWFKAVKDNDVKTVQRMLEDGFDVNIQNEFGETALHAACYRGDFDITQLLIDNGADANIQDIDGWTALHYVCYVDCFDITKLLVDNGADVNIKNNEHLRTPLHFACYLGNLDITKLLMDNGADITARDKDGGTPLDDLKGKLPQKYEELMVWLAEHHPEKVLELIASENSPSKGVGL